MDAGLATVLAALISAAAAIYVARITTRHRQHDVRPVEQIQVTLQRNEPSAGDTRHGQHDVRPVERPKIANPGILSGIGAYLGVMGAFFLYIGVAFEDGGVRFTAQGMPFVLGLGLLFVSFIILARFLPAKSKR